MLYMNDFFRKQGLGILDFLLPETYHAVTLGDFWDNRNKIKGTPLWKIMGAFPAIYIYSARVKVLSEVDITFHKNGFILSDPSVEIRALEDTVLSHESARKENMYEGKYAEVTLRYIPHSDLTILQFIKEISNDKLPDKYPAIEAIPV